MVNNDKFKHIIEINEYSVTYKPGIYFIGDPCYAIQNTPLWDLVVEDPGCYNAYDEFAIAPTMYGDGVYKDVYSGKEFGVDSASLGVVNLKYYEELGAVVEVNEYLTFTYDPDKYSFSFIIDGAAILIPTADEDA
jgi:hypothetical protein